MEKDRLNKLIEDIKEEDIQIIMIQPYKNENELGIAYYKISTFEKLSVEEKTRPGYVKVIRVHKDVTNKDITQKLIDSFKE